MTATELASRLKEAYENALDREKVTQIHLFGIRYADELKNCDSKPGEIARKALNKPRYGTEIYKGMRLAKYVQLKQEKGLPAGRVSVKRRTKATIERLLNTAGKRTFVNCFEALKEKGGGELSQEEVLDADYPDSADWVEGALRAKTSTFNRIVREERECDALRICCEAQGIGKNMQQKAKKLHNKYCNSKP